jgi:predicted RNase H-like HicB family nuclease
MVESYVINGDNGMRQVLIYPGEDGYFVAECPSLPGCISQGSTRPEAIDNIKEAIELYIEVLQAEGQPIPDEKYEAFLVAV